MLEDIRNFKIIPLFQYEVVSDYRLHYGQACPSFHKKQNIDFSEIDRKVQFADAATPALLSQQLTSNYTSDLQKVRAIFRWITDNIAYRTREPISRKRKMRLLLMNPMIQPCSSHWMKG